MPYQYLRATLEISSQPNNSSSFSDMTNRLEQLLEVHNEDPKDAFTRYAIALEYNARNDYAIAIQWFEALRADDADYVPTYYMLAGVYRAADDPEAAKDVYEAGLRAAKRAGDTHTAAEISAALEELLEEME
jgi:Tfp pilus assembly protein PilF